MAEDEAREGPGAATDGSGGEGSSLETQLAAARDEARQNHERWIRERADLENLKRRAARERTETAKFGAESIVRELLPVVDNLERALRASADTPVGNALVDGVRLVLKSLADVLERQGVTPVDAAGAAFDPNHHEAVAHLESDAHPPNTVMEEHQRGYRMHDRLLRPALVTVAKSPANSTDKVAKDGGGD